MKRENTKRDIVRSAERIMRKKSYNSFSYKDLADELGIKKASIHYHYETKQVLGVAIVQNYRSRIEYLTKKMISSESDPIKKLNIFLNFFRESRKIDELCPLGIFGVEYNTVPLEIQSEVKSLFTYVNKLLVETLDIGKSTGVFNFDLPSAQLAVVISTLVEGSLVLSRITSDEEFNLTLDHVWRMVGVTIN